MTEQPWWQTAVIYQIYPRSFADTDGDGIGDLEGIRRHLDHLAWLGVDAIWLSPFFPSPMKDFGYDVSDFCDVDPLFGTLDDFDRLLSEAHERDIKVVIDWVPNHTSDQHPWFVASRSARTNPKRDWYVWRDVPEDRSPPNNWISAFTWESAWTIDETTDQQYLHLFLPEQPDLNWANPEVEAAMHDTLRFWLDRGVDGLRMDVIHAIGKDPDLPDDPPDLVALTHSSLNDHPSTHALLRRIRDLLDGYAGERMMVGEVFLLDTAQVATYYGTGDELHLAFNFPPLFTPWRSDRWAERLDEVSEHIEPRGWPTWVLSNHDNRRQRTRYGGSEAKARAAAVLLLTLRGTPFMYAGEELGLEDAIVPDERVVDPGGRDGCRAPLPWDGSATHGWSDTDPWLPWPPEADSRNVAAQQSDSSSIANLYRRLLSLRHESPALHTGSQARIEAPNGVLAWQRSSPAGEVLTVAVNFLGEPVALDLRGTVVLASDGRGENGPFTGTLAPYQAAILRP